MGTTDNFDTPAASSCLAADQIPVISSATARGATATLAQVLSGLGQVINTTATTLAVTLATHGNRIITISSAAPIAITLPQATGTGVFYRFQMQVVATATGHTIKVANGTDVMQGVSWCLTTSSANVIGYGTSATSDTITVNGTTQGGVVGDIIDIMDVKTGFYSVKIFCSPTGSTATPFSASVS
jgi:hypothetical protein